MCLFSLLHKKLFSETCDSCTIIHLPSFPAVLLMSRLKLSGPCTFESGQCQWTDISDGQSRWQRQKACNGTEPPTDHTTETGGEFSDENLRANMLNDPEIILTALVPQQLDQQ